MLKTLDKFRRNLDEVMYKCMDKRIVLYGYGYSGKFIGWYAEYYHSIKPDYIITQDMTSSIPYEFELYRESLFDFNYKDVKDAIVWLCIPETEEISHRLEGYGYVKNCTYFNFCEIAYVETNISGNENNVQFLRWLEEKYLCDFVTTINKKDFLQKKENAISFVGLTQKELFPLLDKCHINCEDAIFDFGCGKGGAMVSFLDYGFKKVGGIEYQDDIYITLTQNFENIGLTSEIQRGNITCLNGDAATLDCELDGYNWFYFFNPFVGEVFKKTIDNICKSLERHLRRIYIIYILPECHKMIEDTEKFELTNRFTISTRQRVVNIYVSKVG